MAIGPSFSTGLLLPVPGLQPQSDALERSRYEDLDLWSCPFVVVDIETTGSVAGRDGLTEIGLVDVCEGRLSRQWRSFVNPSAPIPRFVSNLTGITDEMVAGAPAVGEVLPAVREFVGDAIVVGHNVHFDVGFIDFELRRHGHPRLENPRVDTLTLARRTIGEVFNYKLGTLTRELGIDVERHHRALADAAATAQLLVHCVKKLEDSGVFTYGALREFLRIRPPARKRPVRSFANVAQLPVWTSTLIEDLAAVPAGPGVYLLRDASRAVVYVGKSRNLRRRVRTYATAGKAVGAKMSALRATVASYDCLRTGSELEALLLESELVKAHDPPYNDRLRNFRTFAFIKVERSPYGRIMATTRLAADGALYFGPYRSMESSRAAVSALQDALDLRGASDAEQIHGKPPPAQYDAQIEQAIACIQGSADDVLLAVARRRDEAAARGRLDVVEREDRRLDRLRRLRERQARLEYVTGLNLLVLAPSIDPSEESCFLFCGGRLAARQQLPRRLRGRTVARKLLATMLADSWRPEDVQHGFARQEEIDQLYILAAWFSGRREGLCYIELPGRRPRGDEAAGWADAILDGDPVT
ncbi:MAG: GIY-YIG nuclease family protein [Candidatus Eremiobacteraeota bacterium]|nr:GIY-YIG nuclease family protein [Candidatus Eremiobacteraeota bacterium]MBC5826955.1 GIY-YIG nuclease family protein [Candidatus Eremiobacteraeota bacterium]